MRIIDKNHDFYDYLQDATDTLIFDRRSSFLLTKEQVCQKISLVTKYNKPQNGDCRLILMQCGATFWVFQAIITETQNAMPTQYELKQLVCWKNYDKPLRLLTIETIRLLGFYSKLYGFLKDNTIHNHTDAMIDKINKNDYVVENTISEYIKSTSHKNEFIQEKLTIPILKACGISDIVDPLEIFCAIEEYFSLLKSASETTEAKGVTNNDKIIMHGFDTKTSFRGK